LRVNGLKTHFRTPRGTVRAVDDISFEIKRGGVFGLVGESGSGKTLTALSVMRLIYLPCEIAGGSIAFNGEDLMMAGERELRAIRGSKIAMIFQEPASAFNPVFTIGYQISEAIRAHRKVKASEARAQALESLESVHISDPRRAYHDYPHQLSGGMKQRAMIAMALINDPQLLILDEPTTALDVTIQAKILDLIRETISARKLSALFISHDFGVVSRMCDTIGVMHNGKIVETGKVGDVLGRPKEDYTVSLIESVKALS
jgi:ABC-type dipeptide/oligopeptide/nickel transport system ATPase component